MTRRRFIAAGKVLAKILVSLGALTWVLQQIELAALGGVLARLSPLALLGAVLLLHGAQLVSAQRMRFYLGTASLALPPASCIRLYYLGMFYNTFLPGGIGGDGYKVYVLKKHHELPYGTAIRLQLSERASGLLILLLLALTLAVGVSPPLPWFYAAVAAGVILGAYRLATALICRERWQVSRRAGAYSLVIQLLTLASAAVLLPGLGVPPPHAPYLLLFILATIAATLPLSVGGVGVRELVFFYGAPLLHVQAETGLALGLAAFATYLLVALSGYVVVMWMKKPAPAHSRLNRPPARG